MKIDKEKMRAALDEYMKNPAWAEYYKNAPSDACKKYIRFTWYRSKYDEPEDVEEFKRIRDGYWKELGVKDWEYLRDTHPGSPFVKLCNQKIKELSK